jgi:DNA-binding transcriptional regulator YdaS (Cro superfamily)
MTRDITRYEALMKVRDHFRSEEEMGKALGVSQPTVWRWLNQLRRLPTRYVLEAERVTRVSRHDLDPHCYPRDYPPAPDARFTGVDRRRAGARA